MIPVILAGGKGERFWPLSRQDHPKQFLALEPGGKTLLQATGDRLFKLTQNWGDLWVVTSENLAKGVKQQLPLLPLENILVEPLGKDTAPAVTFATLEITKKYGENTIIGFFPADHWLPHDQAFQKYINLGEKIALQEKSIVTLGIKPSYPATGYGYIEQGIKQGEIEQISYYQVASFREKPNRETAQQFLNTGKFNWNSGMFIFEGGVMLAELAKYAPTMLSILKEKGAQGYQELTKISIDYTVMEKTAKASILPVDFPWDDLGDWNALDRLLKEENKPNVTVGRAIDHHSNNCLIFNNNPEELIVTIGLEDLIIVKHQKATLIVKKECSQEIKNVLKILGNDKENKDFL